MTKNKKIPFHKTLKQKINNIIANSSVGLLQRFGFLEPLRSQSPSCPKHGISLAVRVPEGKEHALVASLWLQQFAREAPVNIVVDIFSDDAIWKDLCQGGTFYGYRITPRFFGQHANYDITVKISHYFEFHTINMAKLGAASPGLALKMSNAYLFAQRYRKYWKRTPTLDAAWAKLCSCVGWNRYSELWANGILAEKPAAFSFQLSGWQPIFEGIDLAQQKYITIHTTSKPDATRQTTEWPRENWQKLCELMKASFPEWLIVQLGENAVPSIKGVDLNLAGKLSIPRLGFVLAGSQLHVDEDSWLVYLRKSQGGGKSIVLHGPSLAKYRGLSENENISGTECSGCMGMMSTWQKQCLLGHASPLCMDSILPEDVMLKVSHIRTVCE